MLLAELKDGVRSLSTQQKQELLQFIREDMQLIDENEVYNSDLIRPGVYEIFTPEVPLETVAIMKKLLDEVNAKARE